MVDQYQALSKLMQFRDGLNLSNFLAQVVTYVSWSKYSGFILIRPHRNEHPLRLDDHHLYATGQVRSGITSMECGISLNPPWFRLGGV